MSDAQVFSHIGITMNGNGTIDVNILDGKSSCKAQAW
jgi:hypothetical protein